MYMARNGRWLVRMPGQPTRAVRRKPAAAGEVQRRRVSGEDDRGVREHAEEGGDADGEAGEGVKRELASACQEEEGADARAYALRCSRSRAPI